MSHVNKQTPRPVVPRPNTAKGSKDASEELISAEKLPRVEQKSDSPKKPLLSLPSTKAGSDSPASPGKSRPAADSPYKSPSSRTARTAPDEPGSLRAYLQGLRADNLANTIFRDQHTANDQNFPAAWVGLLQAALKEKVSGLLRLVSGIVAEAKKKGVNQLYPAPGGEENFDWQPFADFCARLWPQFSAEVISLAALPPKTLGLLAELHQELADLPAVTEFKADAFEKTLADALFKLLIWNGILSPLTKACPVELKRPVDGFCNFVKFACGMQGQSQGAMAQAIMSLTPENYKKQYAEFRTALVWEVKRLAALRTVKFQDNQHEQRVDKLRERNIDLYFTDSWNSRADDYEKVVTNGNYYLTEADGLERQCKSYADFARYVGAGKKRTLPQVVLHVAGDRIRNFLCNTYLYNIEEPFFTDAHGQRVEPVPDLHTKFVLSRDGDGKITATFSCADKHVESVKLLDPRNEDFELEAFPLFNASIRFDGEFHFFPDTEEFEAGDIEVTGKNLHMFQ